MPTIAEVALLISVVALVVSGASLWHTHLRPFNLEVLTSPPTFRLYPITSGDRKWWIPSFDIAISLYNTGRRPGRVYSFQIVTRIDLDDAAQRDVTFSPRWVVDYAIFHELGSKRSAWLPRAVKRVWYPLLLEPGQTHFHLVLEAMRWTEPVGGTMHVTVEVAKKSSGEYEAVAKYVLPLPTAMFRDRSSMLASPAPGSSAGSGQ